MKLNKLNALVVHRVHREGKVCELLDGAGLYLRKQSAHRASWELRYTFLGRTKYLTLGHYPDMPLSQAREQAREKRVLVDQGVDPHEARRQLEDEQRKAAAFSELCESWYRAEVEHRVKNPQSARRYLEKYLLPKLGRTPSREIRARHLAEILDEIKKRAPTAANDLLRYTQRIFAFGVRHDLVPANPVAGLSPRFDAGGTERPRQRALSLQELQVLFAAIKTTPSFGGDNFLAMKLLLALCVRKGELLAARWDEFDLVGHSEAGPVWHLAADRTKTKSPLDIPLVSGVVGWLLCLKQLSGNSPYVFPQRRRDHRQRVPHVGLDTLNVALNRVEHRLPAFTLHDLRRTARTHLAALDVRREVAERCLGHQLAGIEGIYNRHDYFTERRDALDKWTNLILELDNAKRKFVPIRARDVA